MLTNIDFINKLSPEFKKYNIVKIESGASKKIFYRLSFNQKSFILCDFSLDKKEFNNYLKIFNLLKNIDISVPNIIEKNDKDLLIVSEDFGDLRFDKILKKYKIKNLLKYAVDSLVILNNSIKFDNSLSLTNYNFDIFKSEIMELPDYYFPYIKLKNKNIVDEFIFIWSKIYNNINFKFENFSHKDFNINNLILLPSKKKHLKCGIIDFQSSFWGENSWDLFSLLEDSRTLFTDEYNKDYIEYFYLQTNQNFSITDFNFKFNFLNSARQTRLLGRWVKLSKELNQESYLNYIAITKIRLKKSINFVNDDNLTNFYNKYIFN